MAYQSTKNSKVAVDSKHPGTPPPQHPFVAEDKLSGSKSSAPAELTHTNEDDVLPSSSSKQNHEPKHGFLKRAVSQENNGSAKRFFSAYAETWIGMSPLWLMGEAILPNKKVGTQFNKGRKKLVSAAEEVRQAVTTTGKEVVIIVDEKLKGSGEGGRQIAQRTAEVIKAAGGDAVLVVTTSLEKLCQIAPTKEGDSKPLLDLHKLAHDPELKRTMRRHGRDALVLLDNTLKNPVVITGVSNFARLRGIPYSEALLRVASLGLGKILHALPEDVQEEASEHIEAKIEEMDAEELERQSTAEERKEAASIAQAVEGTSTPKVEEKRPAKGAKDSDPYAELKSKNDCIIM